MPKPQQRQPLNLELSLLGSPQVQVGGQEVAVYSKKILALLAYVALEGPTPRSKLAALLWSDLDEDAARRNLRVGLHRLKEKNPELAPFLESEGESVGLPACESDVQQFEEAIAQNRLGSALEVYRGPLLEGLELTEAEDYLEWLQAKREHFAKQWRSLMLYQAESLETKGDWRGALEIHLKLLNEDSLQERYHREVMRLHYLLGEREAALEQFEQLRTTLKSELGLEPMSETLGLVQTIRQGGTAEVRRASLIQSPELVPDLPSNLFGRDKLLGDVLQQIHKGEKVLLHGFGGMGKTALAARLAHDFLKAQKQPVLWLHLGSLSPEAVFEALAQTYEAGPELSRAADKVQGLRSILQKQQPGLLVLDDAWNAYALGQVIEALPKGLPLLVTSRQRHSGLKRIAVDRLERNAALELLSHHAAQNYSADAGAAALCELLGDHAFAVRLAGLALEREKSLPGALLERIKGAPHDLKVPGELSQAGYESVASLLGLSLEALSDGEYEAFLTYGILPSPTASAGFIAACVRRDPAEVEEALLALTQRGLADRIAKAGSDALSYRLHDLAHSYAQSNRLHRPATLLRAAMGFLEGHKNQVAVLETDITNILSAAQAAHDQGREADLIRYMYLLTVEGTYFTARGHTSSSIELLKRAAEWALQAERLEEAHYLLGKIGDYYANFLGDFSNGIAYYSQAMETARKAGNPAREAIYVSTIGQLKSLQNEPDAEGYFDRAYKITKSIGDDLTLSTVLEKHGYVAGIQGNYDKSFQLLQETLNAIERLESDSNTNQNEIRRRRFFALLNLAEVEHLLGSLDKGLVIFQDALRLAEEVGNEIWSGYAHCQAADMYHRAGDRSHTLEHMQEALKLFERNNARKDIERVKNFLKSEGYLAEEVAVAHP